MKTNKESGQATQQTEAEINRKPFSFAKKQVIFSQGDESDALYYISEGKVKLTVVSKAGKEGTINILNKGDFFGEGCLTGQSFRQYTATALTNCSLLSIEKKTMVEVLYRQNAFSDRFVSYLLTCLLRYEDDLVDHLFNSSEQRLARKLLLLAHFDETNGSKIVSPKISQGTLAEMIGTTRSRTSKFMNKFRKLGLIDYGPGGTLKVNSSLLNNVLHDDES
jgi:CRP/FNR family transcriptional regulator, cyclic AMP receptor protein